MIRVKIRQQLDVCMHACLSISLSCLSVSRPPPLSPVSCLPSPVSRLPSPVSRLPSPIARRLFADELSPGNFFGMCHRSNPPHHTHTGLSIRRPGGAGEVRSRLQDGSFRSPPVDQVRSGNIRQRCFSRYVPDRPGLPSWTTWVPESPSPAKTAVVVDPSRVVVGCVGGQYAGVIATCAYACVFVSGL